MVREMIQKTLDYVDSNIKEDITSEELAEVAGYSAYSASTEHGFRKHLNSHSGYI